jgi:hypothetical protein
MSADIDETLKSLLSKSQGEGPRSGPGEEPAVDTGSSEPAKAGGGRCR